MSASEDPTPPENDADLEPEHIGAGFNFSDPNSPLAPYYTRASHILAFGLIGLVFFYFGVVIPLTHTDFWAHLKYGEWIVTHKQLPPYELFSQFSNPEQPFWNFQWLSQSIFYLVFKAGTDLAQGDELNRSAGGVEMLRSFYGLLISLKVTLILLAIRRATRSLSVAILGAMLLVFLIQAPSRIQRPQVFGEVFFAFTIWWLSGSGWSRFTWIALPSVFVIWANCHGSFGIGYLFLGLIWSGRVIEEAWSQKLTWRESWKASGWFAQGLLTLVLTPLLIGLCNPHGFGIYAGVAAMAQNPNIRTISEWAPLDFGKPIGGHWIYLGTAILLLVSQAVSPRPMKFSRLVVLLAFAVGPLYQQRLLIWWLMLTPWLGAPLWRSTLLLIPRRHYLPTSVASFRKTLIAVALLVIFGTWSGCFHLLLGHKPMELGLSTTRGTLWQVAHQLKYGEEVSPEILTQLKSGTKPVPPLKPALSGYPDGKYRGRIFVQDSMSDYLMWSLPEKAPTLVYNHAHVFPEEVWHHQVTIQTGGPGWASLLDRYQINLVIVDPVTWRDLAYKLREDSNWTLVLDEGRSDSSEVQSTIANTKLLIAVRKTPL